MIAKRERRFRCAVTAGCAALLIAGFLALNPILLPKWLDSERYEPTTEIIQGMYAEPENTIDVLFLGTSHIFCGVSPLSIYDETGLRCYDFATGDQRLWVSYYYMLEALKTQSPSVVVLDTYKIFLSEMNWEERNRMALDYLKWSDVKWNAIQASMMPEESMLTYVFPALRFHDRYLDLRPEDFWWPFRQDRRNPMHGYRFAYMDRITPVTFMRYEDDPDAVAPSWEEGCLSRNYLDQIVEVCRSRGIRLLLVTMPMTTAWNGACRDAIDAYADAHGIRHVDFIPQMAELGLSPETDFYDSTHLNIFGADKFSRQFADMLAQMYFPGERRPDADPDWDRDYGAYARQLDEARRRCLP